MNNENIEVAETALGYQEVTTASHTHSYTLSVKTAIWVTLLLILILVLLYPLNNFPPTLGEANQSSSYFHSIGLVSLIVLLVILFFDLRKHEPIIDFQLPTRALLKAVLAAVTGLLYLHPILSSIPQIPAVLFLLTALFTIDITGAALAELLLLPRKLGGAYNLDQLASKPFFQKYVRAFLFTKEDRQTYSLVDSAFWLVAISLGALLVSELIGFVLMWITDFGPGFLGAYVNSLGGSDATTSAILDPHSHGAAVALMAAAIGLVVHRFGVLRTQGWKRNLTRTGMWLSSIALALLMLVYVAGALVNYAPPTLFASGPQGINGMAGDDALMTLVILGGVLAVLPLALTDFRGKRSWHDWIRLATLFTMFMWFVSNVMAGFFIEFNESAFQAELSANDAAFSEFQPMFGIFFLIITAMVLLAADYFEGGSKGRRNISVAASSGVLVATIGGLAWVFLDPSTSSYYFWTYILGVLLICISILGFVIFQALPSASRAATRGVPSIVEVRRSQLVKPESLGVSPNPNSLGGEKMKALNWRAAAIGLAFAFALTYVLCLLGDVLFGWTMYRVWAGLFPGFALDPLGFLVGLVESIVYGVYAAIILIVPYNAARDWFEPVTG